MGLVFGYISCFNACLSRLTLATERSFNNPNKDSEFLVLILSRRLDRGFRLKWLMGRCLVVIQWCRSRERWAGLFELIPWKSRLKTESKWTGLGTELKASWKSHRKASGIVFHRFLTFSACDKRRWKMSSSRHDSIHLAIHSNYSFVRGDENCLSFHLKILHADVELQRLCHSVCGRCHWVISSN